MTMPLRRWRGRGRRQFASKPVVGAIRETPPRKGIPDPQHLSRRELAQRCYNGLNVYRPNVPEMPGVPTDDPRWPSSAAESGPAAG